MNYKIFRPSLRFSFFIISIYYFSKFRFRRLRVSFEKRIFIGFCVTLESSKDSRNIKVNYYKKRKITRPGHKKIYKITKYIIDFNKIFINIDAPRVIIEITITKRG